MTRNKCLLDILSTCLRILNVSLKAPPGTAIALIIDEVGDKPYFLRALGKVAELRLNTRGWCTLVSSLEVCSDPI